MELETLATGFGLLESARVDEQGRLYFSDIPNGGVFRRSPDGKIETLISDRKGVGGVALCEDGGIVVSGPGLAKRDAKTGELRDIFTKFENRTIKGLNDLTTDSQGSIYVGSLNHDPFRDKVPVTGDLYRVDPDGKVSLLWEGIRVTNGMGFSPDGKLLYHVDSAYGVYVYDVASDRTVHNRRFFAKPPEGFADGLTIDAEGGVWVAAILGYEVVRFKPDATVDRRMRLPFRKPVTLTFGGPGLHDLYILTADNSDPALKGSIFRTRSDIPGLAVPKARL